MVVTGSDIDAWPTLHMLGAMHKGLEGKLTSQQHAVLGQPSTTPDETAAVIETIRAEMAHAGPSCWPNGMGLPIPTSLKRSTNLG